MRDDNFSKFDSSKNESRLNNLLGKYSHIASVPAAAFGYDKNDPFIDDSEVALEGAMMVENDGPLEEQFLIVPIKNDDEEDQLESPKKRKKRDQASGIPKKRKKENDEKTKRKSKEKKKEKDAESKEKRKEGEKKNKEKTEKKEKKLKKEKKDKETKKEKTTDPEKVKKITIKRESKKEEKKEGKEEEKDKTEFSQEFETAMAVFEEEARKFFQPDVKLKNFPKELDPLLHQVCDLAKGSDKKGHLTKPLMTRLLKFLPFQEVTLKSRYKKLSTLQDSIKTRKEAFEKYQTLFHKHLEQKYDALPPKDKENKKPSLEWDGETRALLYDLLTTKYSLLKNQYDKSVFDRNTPECNLKDEFDKYVDQLSKQIRQHYKTKAEEISQIYREEKENKKKEQKAKQVSPKKKTSAIKSENIQKPETGKENEISSESQKDEQNDGDNSKIEEKLKSPNVNEPNEQKETDNQVEIDDQSQSQSSQSSNDKMEE